MLELGPTIIERTSDGQPWYVRGLPVEGNVTSPFGPREPIWTPAGWTSGFHSGVDIAAPFGTPIRCPAPGTVTWSGRDSVGAQIVTVEFEDGTGASFVHMEGPQAALGTRLARGDILGYIGTSGMSTGPHLHYMRMRYVVRSTAFWYPQDSLIDPLGAEGGHVEVLSPAIEVESPAVRDVLYGGYPMPGQGKYMAVIADCTPVEVINEGGAEGCNVLSLWVYQNGGWKGYYAGAPRAVNEGFPETLRAGSALYVQA